MFRIWEVVILVRITGNDIKYSSPVNLKKTSLRIIVKKPSNSFIPLRVLKYKKVEKATSVAQIALLLLPFLYY